MKNWIKKIWQSFKTWRYFSQCMKESVIMTLERDRRANYIAVLYPITAEDARKLIDIADAYRVPMSVITNLIEFAYKRGQTPGYLFSYVSELLAVMLPVLKRSDR